MTSKKRNDIKSTRWAERCIQYGPFLLVGLLFLCCMWIEIGQIELSRDVRKQIYSVVGTTMLYLSIGLNILLARKYGLSLKASVIYSYVSFRVIFNLVSLLWMKIDVLLLGSGSIASFRSILFMPIIALPFSRLSRIKFCALCDCLTPFFFFNHGAVTTACWIMGCCAGRRFDWGVRSPLTGEILFPLQPLIILASLATAWVGLEYAKRHGYKTNGRVYAGSMMLYGYFRYMLELFSDDPRIVWNLSLYSICSLVMIAVGGMIWWITRTKVRTE